KADGPAAEAREGRERAKGNSPERNALRTQGRESTPSALERLRQARWFPPARVGHRYPLVRLGVFTHGGSPVTPLGRFCGGGHARCWAPTPLQSKGSRGREPERACTTPHNRPRGKSRDTPAREATSRRSGQRRAHTTGRKQRP